MGKLRCGSPGILLTKNDKQTQAQQVAAAGSKKTAISRVPPSPSCHIKRNSSRLPTTSRFNIRNTAVGVEIEPTNYCAKRGGSSIDCSCSRHLAVTPGSTAAAATAVAPDAKSVRGKHSRCRRRNRRCFYYLEDWTKQQGASFIHTWTSSHCCKLEMEFKRETKIRRRRATTQFVFLFKE